MNNKDESVKKKRETNPGNRGDIPPPKLSHEIKEALRNAIGNFTISRFTIKKVVGHDKGFKRGTKGVILDPEAINFFPGIIRDGARAQLEKFPELKLCVVGGWLYFLPDEFIRLPKSKTKGDDNGNQEPKKDQQGETDLLF